MNKITRLFNKSLGLLPKNIRYHIRSKCRLVDTNLHPELDDIDFTNDSKIIFDVGANYGGFMGSILLREPLATVHCFEPNPEIFPDLKLACEKVGQVGKRARAVANWCGIGAQAGESELIVTSMHAASSFLPVSKACTDGWPDVDFSTKNTVEVPVISIEEYAQENSILNVKLLKADTQGYELEVLRGCGDFIHKIEYIFLEVQFRELYVGAPTWDKLVKFLFDRRFAPVSMAGFCLDYDGGLLQADLLFKNKLQV